MTSDMSILTHNVLEDWIIQLGVYTTALLLAIHYIQLQNMTAWQQTLISPAVNI